MPLITVLTAFRDASAHIAETIESIRGQTVTDWEYILVDDGSKDESPAMVESIARTDPRIRVVHLPVSVGPYAAANRGLAVAEGTYVARLDADDLATRTRFARQLDFLEAHDDLRACSCGVVVLTEGFLHEPEYGPLPTRPRSLKWRLCVRPGLAHSTAFVERSALLELGGYRELALAQDYRLWCELSRRDWLGVVDEVLVHWRKHADQVTQTQADVQAALGLDVLTDHLTSIDLSPWSSSDADMLRSVGLRRLPIARGLRLIARFERAWRSDASLSAEEHIELKRLTNLIRAQHLRAAAYSSIERIPGGSRLLRARRMVRSWL